MPEIHYFQRFIFKTVAMLDVIIIIDLVDGSIIVLKLLIVAFPSHIHLKQFRFCSKSFKLLFLCSSCFFCTFQDWLVNQLEKIILCFEAFNCCISILLLLIWLMVQLFIEKKILHNFLELRKLSINMLQR